MARLWQALKQEAGRDDIEYPKHNPIPGRKKGSLTPPEVSTPKKAKAVRQHKRLAMGRKK